MDRIDLAILKLLQQRTRLSRLIGEAKRRHGAVIYVPSRERKLLDRVERLSRGKLPPQAVSAIYREILSSSRAAQGQDAIGLLAGGAELIAAARDHFGSCNELVTRRSWADLSRALQRGSVSLALLTGEQLLRALDDSTGFLKRWRVTGDFAGPSGPIYIIDARPKTEPVSVRRAFILIECKSTTNAVRSWVNSMPKRSIEIGPRRGAAVLATLRSRRPLRTDKLAHAALRFSVLGGSEDYA